MSEEEEHSTPQKKMSHVIDLCDDEDLNDDTSEVSESALTSETIRDLTDENIEHVKTELEERLKIVRNEVNRRKRNSKRSESKSSGGGDTEEKSPEPTVRTTGTAKRSPKTVSTTVGVEITGTVKTLKEVLDEHNVTYKKSLKKDELIELIIENDLVDIVNNTTSAKPASRRTPTTTSASKTVNITATRAKIMEVLDEAGIEFLKGMKKNELIDLITENDLVDQFD
jgi:hypothetical protein